MKMNQFTNLIVKSLAIAGIVSLSINAYANKKSMMSPLNSQKFAVSGVEIAREYGSFIINAQCNHCVSVAVKDPRNFFVNYLPTNESEQGKIEYDFFGDLINNSLYCAYEVSIPFTIDRSGNFIVNPSVYPAHLYSESPKECEKHATTSVTIVGDTINLNNKVLN